MNAYRLARFVEQNNVTRLVKLSTPAIYKSCKRLFEQGNLSGQRRREGEAPEKMMYQVTDAGHERFRELMTHFADTITPFYFDINSVVFSLDQLDYQQGLELIDSYITQISTLQSWLIPHSREAKAKASFASRMIVRQYLMIVDTLVMWVEELREEFIKQHN